jgi:hypothetical protein
MSHPVGNSDAVPAAVGPVNSGYGPYGPPPGYPGAPVPPPQQGSLQRPPGRGRLVAAIGATALISAVAGGLVGGGLVTARQSEPVEPRPTATTAAPPAPTADQIHDADVQLCTSFVISNSAMPNPQKTALEVLPGANALKIALAENPDATPKIRDAVQALVTAYDSVMANFGNVRTRGYAEPPKYDGDAFDAAFSLAWDACQLGS